jgi:hypothetical protein
VEPVGAVYDLVPSLMNEALNYLGRHGTITDFDYPSAVGTSATAIHTAGTITGFYKDSNGITHGFVRTKKGAFTSFDGPNNPEQTAGWGINTSGVITGLYQDGGGGVHGFVRATNGTITTFNAPGTGTVGALVPGGFEMGINTAGTVVGYSLDSGSVFHGYLFVP